MRAKQPAQPPVFTVTTDGGTVTVMLRGEFDMTSEDFLSGCLEQIRSGRPRRLVFEASRVSFMDCASARLIGGTSQWLPVGVKAVINCPSPIVRRVLEVTGIGAHCELEP